MSRKLLYQIVSLIALLGLLAACVAQPAPTQASSSDSTVRGSSSA